MFQVPATLVVGVVAVAGLAPVEAVVIPTGARLLHPALATASPGTGFNHSKQVLQVGSYVQEVLSHFIVFLQYTDRPAS